ncbi:uncharacterized protein STEHIDRAFT_123121 [Stereum hirsutum FP-91666 SS1]|uniref:uncharacterized protein n=1 Tax=Stereum hirsutum (strain FP-91666) TaxID=721885 RepID=UPI0004449D82|nr:uncharacterized protein STEHIDRAFT_123121 [Stereum hirsutum FP-91666 SS1]EIM84304.1 hypothetical protein STEHIDRAFT_123121 [Stereum hirsutum FP-91666 SS1]
MDDFQTLEELAPPLSSVLTIDTTNVPPVQSPSYPCDFEHETIGGSIQWLCIVM